MQLNKDVYIKSEYTKTVIARRGLQPAEKTAFELIFKEKERIAILDIGVGGGRTTEFLEDKASRYVGIDYSPTMVAACRRKFEKARNASFQLCDARDLSRFKDNEFDLVVFSFNGIDNLDPQGRNDALKEMRRVLKSGGYLLFSSHSTAAIKKEFSFKVFSLRYRFLPMVYLASIYNYIMMPVVNRHIDLSTTPDMVVIKYPDASFKQMFVSPVAQTKMLRQLEFIDIRVLSFSTGLELNKEQMKLSEDNWLYYLCRKHPDNPKIQFDFSIM